MQENGERPQLDYRGRRADRRGPGLLTRILAVAGGLLVLAGAVAISVVVFVIALAAVVLFGLYVWWKNRHVIRQVREQMRSPPSPYNDGNVIEGEVVRKEDRPRTP